MKITNKKKIKFLSLIINLLLLLTLTFFLFLFFIRKINSYYSLANFVIFLILLITYSKLRCYEFTNSGLIVSIKRYPVYDKRIGRPILELPTELVKKMEMKQGIFQKNILVWINVNKKIVKLQYKVLGLCKEDIQRFISSLDHREN